MLRTPFKRFARKEDGTFSVETVLIYPLLIWALSAMFIFWDGFKVNNNAISATYTVADLISRQTSPITDDFVNGLDTLYSVIAENREDNDLRVTVVQLTEGDNPVVDPPELELVWSYGTAGLPKRENINDVKNIVPLMAVGATMIVVESRTVWEPPLDWNIGGMTFENITFTSPRFVPQIKFDDGTGDSGGIGFDDGDGDAA